MLRLLRKRYRELGVFLFIMGLMLLGGRTVKAEETGYKFCYSTQRVTSYQGCKPSAGYCGRAGYINIWDEKNRNELDKVSLRLIRNGTEVSSHSGTANGSIYSTSLTIYESAGTYSIAAQITDKAGKTYSGETQFTIYDVTPVVSSHPSSKSVREGTAVSFYVSLKQGTNVRYQWYRLKKGDYMWRSIPGATSATYTIPANSVKYSLDGSLYYCKLSNENDRGTAVNTKEATLRVKGVSPPKIAARLASPNSVRLTWKKADRAVGYKVYRAQSKYGSYRKIATTKKTTYTDKKLKQGRTYYYKVASYSKLSTGEQSGAVSKKIPAKIGKPKLKLTVGGGKFTLTWGSVKGAEQVEIWLQIDNGKWKKFKTVSANKKEFSYSYDNINWSKKCSLKVRGIWKSDGMTGYGDYSKVVAFGRRN